MLIKHTKTAKLSNKWKEFLAPLTLTVVFEWGGKERTSLGV